MSRDGWFKSTKQTPCPCCGNDSGWCKGTHDGAWWCGRYQGACPPGWRITNPDAGPNSSVFRAESDTRERPPLDPEVAQAEREAAERDKEQRRADAKAIWSAATGPIEHAAAYFKARGINVSQLHGGKIPESIRYHESLAHEFGVPPGPAVVGAMLDVEGRGGAVQRIYLDPAEPTRKRTDTDKVKIAKGAASGCACRLTPKDAYPGGTLVLCEGIETGLAIASATKLATWAAISTSGLISIELPDTIVGPRRAVNRIVIAADHDGYKKSGNRPGEAAARIAANAIAHSHPHLEVAIALPSPVDAPELFTQETHPGDGLHDPIGKSVDWLDVLNAAGAAAVIKGIERAQILHQSEEVVDTTAIGDDTPERARQMLLAGFSPPRERRAGECFELQRVNGQWYRRGGTAWHAADDPVVLRARATAVLSKFEHVRIYKDGSESRSAYDPGRDTVNAIVEQCAEYVDHGKRALPFWLAPDFDGDGEPIWRDRTEVSDRQPEEPIRTDAVIAFRNCLIDGDLFAAGESLRKCVRQPTSRWFSPNYFDSDLPIDELDRLDNGGVECWESWFSGKMRWFVRFVDSLFGGDDERWEQFHRFVGYLISRDMSLQKALWIPGPPGCGKSLLCDFLRLVLGEENCAAGDMSAWGERFGLEGLMAVLAVFFEEMHAGRQTDMARFIDRMKKTITYNVQTMEEKNLGQRTNVRLRAKLIIALNEIPRLRDPSASIARRLLCLPAEPFEGEPDLTYIDKMRPEVPAVRVWALMGFRKVYGAVLQGEPAFVQPRAGLAELGEVQAAMAGMREWIEDNCIFGEGQAVRTELLAKAYNESRSHELGAETFGTEFNAAVRSLKHHVERSRRRNGGRMLRFYKGVRLRIGDDQLVEDEEGALKAGMQYARDTQVEEAALEQWKQRGEALCLPG